jgi:tRNA A37 threonylcarbamoyltransferase TsaD
MRTSLIIPRLLKFNVRRSITVLAIESSCDDSCVAIVNSEKKVLSQRRLSFVETQRQLKGISPLASGRIYSLKRVLLGLIFTRVFVSRNFVSIQIAQITNPTLATLHRANIDRLVDECINEAGIRATDLDAVACTVEPGLILCLLVGIDKALALCR